MLSCYTAAEGGKGGGSTSLSFLPFFLVTPPSLPIPITPPSATLALRLIVSPLPAKGHHSLSYADRYTWLP